MDLKTIANHLFDIACDTTYHETALKEARKLVFLTDEDRRIIDAYLTGTAGGTDHVGLQHIAIRIHREAM